MGECIERERLLRKFNIDDMMNVNGTLISLREARETISNFPAADVAPVVWCKNCERAEPYERLDGVTGYYCGHPQNIFTYGERWDRVFKPVKEANDFCSYGERRTKRRTNANEPNRA